MKTAKWIWYPGDLEAMLMQRVMGNRYERNMYIPCFWRVENFNPSVRFVREFSLKKADALHIRADGVLSIRLGKSGKPVQDIPAGDGILALSAGRYRLELSVFNLRRIPSVYVQGEGLVSDEAFEATCNDDVFMNAACGSFSDPECPPGKFALSERPEPYRAREELEDGAVLFDFGKEMFAKLRLFGKRGATYRIFYGESREEALDEANCEQFEDLCAESEECVVSIAKAFRFAKVAEESGASFDAEAVSEFLPMERKADFCCSDPLIDAIYQTAYETFFLNCKEFFFDGIKRDRWVWSGDVSQCHLMNFYSFFDTDISKRSAVGVAGKSPVKIFMNHIMDYSLLWVISLWDIYRYTGDIRFLRQNYGMMEEILAFTATRLTENGFLRGIGGDWVFVDWAELDNRGEVCAEQIYYWKALKTAAAIARLLRRESAYESAADALKRRIESAFWDKRAGSYIYSLVNGAPDGLVRKQPNILAVLFEFCGERKKRSILKNVLLNDAVPAIHTPYMRFFELSALCKLGQYDFVFDEIKRYWGGMLRRGATTFWETFDENEQGAAAYAMYGRKYGKSLCHAWGASPLYLLGRYFAGVGPLKAGYKTFEAEPALNAMEWFSAEIPTNGGTVRLRCSKTEVEIFSSEKGGILWLPSNKKTLSYGRLRGERVCVAIQPGRQYSFSI